MELVQCKIEALTPEEVDSPHRHGHSKDLTKKNFGSNSARKGFNSKGGGGGRKCGVCRQFGHNKKKLSRPRQSRACRRRRGRDGLLINSV